MIFLFTLVMLTYSLMVIALLIGWESIPVFSSTNDSIPSTFVTVIISVRNEEENIDKLFHDLNNQNYPLDLMEIILVDDFSTDATVVRAEKWKTRISTSLKILQLPKQYENSPGKKKSIELAISESKGTLIVTTDADCRMTEDWIKTIEEYFRTFSCKMICGPVYIQSEGRMWDEMQRIEFSSLIGSGAACLALGFPNMCNGANLAYSKEAFYNVNGFDGNDRIASGDDEFLMHKIYNKFPNSVKFLKSKDVIVTTSAKENVKEFLQQRRRWASKWSHYKIPFPKILALFIFTFNFFLLMEGILSLLRYFPSAVFLEQFLIKILVEFVFLRRIVGFSGFKINILVFLLLEFLYPLYVLLVALTGQKGGYEWKGRIVKGEKFDRQGI